MSHEESNDASIWAWATEHGAPEWASTEQLVVWLGGGELPAHTLVWRRGWGEWLPAMQVAELAAAFPGVTAGSRRTARVASDVARPPPVPIAHYPRLRLLAKDVLSESPLPPRAAPAASLSLATVAAERRALRDLDRLQQDVATSQVPAAAMLEAARAMKERGAPSLQRSAERWAQLQLGRFGDPPPPAQQPAACADPPVMELLAPAPAPSKAGFGGGWLWFGALAGSALGLLSVFGAQAAGSLARAGLSLPAVAAVGTAPEPEPRIDTRVLSLAPLNESTEENACMAPPGPQP